MVIDKDVPIPPKGSKSKWTEIAEKMNPGDSIKCDSYCDLECLRNAIKRVGFKAATRKQGGELRAWRIK